MYHYDYSFIHRGISLSTFIKPIMAIYTFLFGSYQIPLSSYYIDILFTVYGIMIIYGFYKLLSDHNIYHPIFLAGVLPLIISIFLIEPLSLPAMTQIAPHHILFLFPWLVFIFYYIVLNPNQEFLLSHFYVLELFMLVILIIIWILLIMVRF